MKPYHYPDRIRGLVKPYRYIFVKEPKPWYWVLTFWDKQRWTDYGSFVRILPGDLRYEDAPYELCLLSHPINDSFVKKMKHL